MPQVGLLIAVGFVIGWIVSPLSKALKRTAKTGAVILVGIGVFVVLSGGADELGYYSAGALIILVLMVEGAWLGNKIRGWLGRT